MSNLPHKPRQGLIYWCSIQDANSFECSDCSLWAKWGDKRAPNFNQSHTVLTLCLCISYSQKGTGKDSQAICVGASMTTQSHSLASSSKNLGAGHTNSSRRGKIKINRPSLQFSVISWRYSEKWQSSEGELLWHATVCAMILSNPILSVSDDTSQREWESEHWVYSVLHVYSTKQVSVCLFAM
jgi:hypothetical protein